MKITLFIPCFIDMCYPKTGISIVQIFERLHIRDIEFAQLVYVAKHGIKFGRQRIEFFAGKFQLCEGCDFLNFFFRNHI